MPMQDEALSSLHAAFIAVGIPEVQITRSQEGRGDWVSVIAWNEEGTESRVMYSLDPQHLTATPGPIEFIEASIVRFLVGKTLLNLSQNLFPTEELVETPPPTNEEGDGDAQS